MTFLSIHVRGSDFVNAPGYMRGKIIRKDGVDYNFPDERAVKNNYKM